MYHYNINFQRGQCQYCRSEAVSGETVCKEHRVTTQQEKDKQKEDEIRLKIIEELKADGFTVKHPDSETDSTSSDDSDFETDSSLSESSESSDASQDQREQLIAELKEEGFIIQSPVELPKDEVLTLDQKQVLKMTISERFNPAEFYIKTRDAQKEIITDTYKAIGVEIEKDSNAGKFSTTFTIKNCADYLYTTLWSLLEEDGFKVVITRKEEDTVLAISWKEVANDKFMLLVRPTSDALKTV